MRLCIIKPKTEMKVFYFTVMSSGKIIECRWYINTENLWNETEEENGSTLGKRKYTGKTKYLGKTEVLGKKLSHCHQLHMD